VKPEAYDEEPVSPDDDEGIGRLKEEKKEEDADSDIANTDPDDDRRSSVRRARETWQRQQRARKNEPHADRLPIRSQPASSAGEWVIDNDHVVKKEEHPRGDQDQPKDENPSSPTDDEAWGEWKGAAPPPPEAWQGGTWTDWENPYPSHGSRNEPDLEQDSDQGSAASSTWRGGYDRSYRYPAVWHTRTSRISRNGIERAYRQPGEKRRGKPQEPKQGRWER